MIQRTDELLLVLLTAALVLLGLYLTFTSPKPQAPLPTILVRK